MRPCAGARDLIANLIQGTVCLFEKEDQGVSEGLEGLTEVTCALLKPDG